MTPVVHLPALIATMTVVVVDTVAVMTMEEDIVDIEAMTVAVTEATVDVTETTDTAELIDTEVEVVMTDTDEVMTAAVVEVTATAMSVEIVMVVLVTPLHQLNMVIQLLVSSLESHTEVETTMMTDTPVIIVDR